MVGSALDEVAAVPHAKGEVLAAALPDVHHGDDMLPAAAPAALHVHDVALHVHEEGVLHVHAGVEAVLHDDSHAAEVLQDARRPEPHRPWDARKRTGQDLDHHDAAADPDEAAQDRIPDDDRKEQHAL